MGSLIEELNLIEKQAEDLRKEIIDKISTAVETTPLDGVTVLSKAPRAVSVKLSSVMTGPFILSPEYYIPESQAEAIRRKLSACQSTTALCAAVKEMIDTKKVRFSHNMHDDAVMLNAQSLKILRESEIGKYVTSQV